MACLSWFGKVDEFGRSNEFNFDFCFASSAARDC